MIPTNAHSITSLLPLFPLSFGYLSLVICYLTLVIDCRLSIFIYLSIYVQNSSNIEIGEIAACAYQVSATSSVRALQTGLQYSLPPAGGGVFCPQQAAAELSVDEFRTRLLDLEQRTITANAATAAANANAVESDVYSNTDKDKGQGRNNGKKKRRGRSDSPGLSLARALTLLYVWRGGCAHQGINT